MITFNKSILFNINYNRLIKLTPLNVSINNSSRKKNQWIYRIILRILRLLNLVYYYNSSIFKTGGFRL